MANRSHSVWILRARNRMPLKKMDIRLSSLSSLRIVCIAMLLCWAPLSPAQEYTVNLNDTDIQEFIKFKVTYFNGNFKNASIAIGESREKVGGIFDRAGVAQGGQGSLLTETITTPKNTTKLQDLSLIHI